MEGEWLVLLFEIDDQAQSYLSRMFGAASYRVVEKVAQLPYRVSDIYLSITA